MRRKTELGGTGFETCATCFGGGLHIGVHDFHPSPESRSVRVVTELMLAWTLDGRRLWMESRNEASICAACMLVGAN